MGAFRVASLVRLGLAGGMLLLAGCVGQPQVVSSNGYGYVCYAGVYTCRLQAQYPVGAPCSCPGIGAPSYGTVH